MSKTSANQEKPYALRVNGKYRHTRSGATRLIVQMTGSGLVNYRIMGRTSFLPLVATLAAFEEWAVFEMLTDGTLIKRYQTDLYA